MNNDVSNTFQHTGLIGGNELFIWYERGANDTMIIMWNNGCMNVEFKLKLRTLYKWNIKLHNKKKRSYKKRKYLMHNLSLTNIGPNTALNGIQDLPFD